MQNYIQIISKYMQISRQFLVVIFHKCVHLIYVAQIGDTASVKHTNREQCDYSGAFVRRTLYVDVQFAFSVPKIPDYAVLAIYVTSISHEFISSDTYFITAHMYFHIEIHGVFNAVCV